MIASSEEVQGSGISSKVFSAEKRLPGVVGLTEVLLMRLPVMQGKAALFILCISHRGNSVLCFT